jgi:putative ABC transport system substrate-binding protein
MKRREFITLVGCAAIAPSLLRPLVARAQPAGKVVRVGFLGPGLDNPPPLAHFRAFLARLRELGFSEGRNLAVDHRNVGDPRGPFVAAADLLRLQPDLIVALGPEVALQAVIGASRAVPVVFVAVNYDPIARGYVQSLARPGGNVTGVFLRQTETAAKQVELLTQAFPGKTRLAVLWDAQTRDQFSTVEQIAKPLNVTLQSIKLENPPYDFEAAMRTVLAGGAQMLLVQSSPHFIPRMPRIAAMAIEHRLPGMFTARQWVEVGGLMSYGVNFPTMYRRAADYVARILKGEKPADLPVEQASKFELVINLKTAKAIGVELPAGILVRADEVIE